MKTKARRTSRRRMGSRGRGEPSCRNSGRQRMRLLLSSLFVLAGIPPAPGSQVKVSEGGGGDRDWDIMVSEGEHPRSESPPSSSSSSSASAPESRSGLGSPPKLLSFDLIPAREVLERGGGAMTDHGGGEGTSEHHRRLRAVRLGHDQFHTDTLYQGYGTHYVDLWVGSPVPQRQTVIVDTGSPSTAFPCSGCKGNCGERYHTDAYFDPSRSVTFRRLSCLECGQGVCKRGDAHADGAPPPPPPSSLRAGGAGGGGDGDAFCDMQLRYGEGSSWSAYEAEDVLYTGGAHTEGVTGGRLAGMVTPVTFGCQRSVTGLFKTQLADGIMGMSKNVNSFWDQLYKAGKIDTRQFSLCYSRHRTTERSGTRAGFMTLGGTDPSRHTSPMVYARDVGQTGAYSVHMRKIYLRRNGGESVRPSTSTTSSSVDRKLVRVDIDESTLNSNGFMVDSGSSDTYFPVALLEPFKEAWEEVTGKKYTTSPIRLTDEQLSKLPTIIIQLKGSVQDSWNSTGAGGTPIDPMYPRDVAIAVPATRYLTYSGGRYYNGIRMEKDSTDGILGANTMQGHDVLFDFENSRIGFAEADCDLPAGRSTSEAHVESIPPEDKFPIPAHHPDHFDFLHPERYLATALGWNCDSTTDCAGFVVIFLLSFVVNLLVVSIVLRRLGPRWRRMRVRLFDRVDKDGGDEVSSLVGGSSSSLIMDKPPSRMSI